jgi:kynurenine formamidase
MESLTEHALWSVCRDLAANARFVDLTHAFHPGQPHFPAFPDEHREMLFDMSVGAGFNVHQYTIVGQWGTHVDPPVHFIEGARTVDEIPVEEMILPLVVLDISERAVADPDATPTLADVAAWEERHGQIPRGAFVALRTGWGLRWPDRAAMANVDQTGVSHCPGWSAEVLKYLLEEAGATAIGHEQTDTDPGAATSQGDFSLERYVLERDRWQIELMANLQEVPEAGALLIATWPKPRGGSGFPARVIAICPAR